MDDNMTMRLEIARRIYDLDAEVYRVLGSSLGRVFNSDRDMTVRRLANLMGDFTQGHYLRSELALISNMARTIPVKADRSRLMTEYNEILHALDKLPTNFNSLDILDPKDFRFLWVTEFPMFEWSEEENRYMAMHHPFTAPMVEDEDKILTDKANCRARAYDIVLNGVELGGGSIRINTPEMQEKAFQALGISEEDIQERFGHLVNAFKFGAPPHGGLAYGLDRLCMLMAGAPSIRDVIAFPKVQNASDLMMACPDVVDDKQLDDLSIAVTRMEQSDPEAEQ